MCRQDLRQLLRYIYAEQLILTYQNLTVMPKCNGCKIDHPSQWQHSCIDPAGHLVSTLYGIASASLDEGRLKAIFAEAANSLGLDYRQIDIESTLHEYLECWEATGYRDIEKNRNEDQYYVRAIAAATTKVNSLEKRLMKL